MAQVTLVGRITADIEVKQSRKKEPYVRFEVVENYRTARAQSFQICAFGRSAEALVRQSVKKGSFIRISGTIELEEYAHSGGRLRDKRMKIFLHDWDFADLPQTLPDARYGSIDIIDGEREPLPE